MTEISAPWAGIALGDATLAPYSDQEWAQIWRDLLRASKADSGPFLGSGTSPDPGLTVRATTPASANVEVTIGSALVRGTWYNTSATVTLPIAANGSGNPRIDTVVLQKDYATQTIRLVVIQGAPNVAPVPLALTQTDGVLWEIPLGDIAVANGFATITAANVKVRRHWANLADAIYLHDVLNNSGGLLETGDVVVWDTTADRAIKTSAVVGDGNVAGVWVGQTAAGGYGRVLTKGVGYVRCSGAVAARGLVLIPSGTAKLAVAASTAATASKRNAVGVSLQITGAAGLCLAMVDIGKQRDGAIVQITASGAGTNNTAVFADVNAGSQVAITPHGTRVRVTAMLQGKITNAADAGNWDIYSVGLAARAGDASLGLQRFVDTVPVGDFHPVAITAIFTGLTPGISQVFKLQHRVETGAGAIVTTSAALVMYAEEI